MLFFPAFFQHTLDDTAHQSHVGLLHDLHHNIRLNQIHWEALLLEQVGLILSVQSVLLLSVHILVVFFIQIPPALYHHYTPKSTAFQTTYYNKLTNFLLIFCGFYELYFSLL